MRRTIYNSSTASARPRWITLAATLLVAVAEARTEEKSVQPLAGIAAGKADADAQRVIVSIPDRKLALVQGDRVVKVYAVAVGAPDSPTPAGEFRIVQRITQPTYYAPGKVIPPGKVNPLGPRWIGLSQKGFGIHGTNEPRSIGRRASHGCIRMRNRDVVELFELVRVGDAVELRAERTTELAQIFGTAVAPAQAVSVVAAAAPAVGTTVGGQY